jgi:O-methyltransferase involved in polyketide biosynthesis
MTAMVSKQAVRLGQVHETMLIPLYCRAVETRRKRPILKDPKAVEIVASAAGRTSGSERRKSGLSMDRFGFTTRSKSDTF